MARRDVNTAERVCVICLSLGILITVSVPVAMAAGWAPTGDLLEARDSYGRATLDDGSVLVCGGQYGSTTYASCEIYDPGTGTWSSTGGLSQARQKFALVRLTDGRFLALGGLDLYGGIVEQVEIYSPSAGTWSPGASMLTPRKAFGVALLTNGKVLVAGGQSDVGTGHDTAELYDPVADSFSYTGSMRDARFAFGTVLLGNGQVLVAGDGNGGTACELYDPATEGWSVTGSMLSGPKHFSLAAISSSPSVTRVLRFGGTLTESEIFDSSTATWAYTGSMSTALEGHGWTKLPSGNILVAGGVAGAASFTNIVEEYQVVSGNWISRPSMIDARAAFSLTLLSSTGKVLAAAGTGYSGAISTAELYTPVGRRRRPPRRIGLND